MNVIKRKTLETFWRKHPKSKDALLAWFKVSRKARWRNYEETKRTFPSTDVYNPGKGKRTATIFDIVNNNYRLIALIDYRKQRMLVTDVLTHKEYDTDRWKDKL